MLHELQYLDKVHPRHFTLDLDQFDRIFHYRFIQSSSFSRNQCGTPVYVSHMIKTTTRSHDWYQSINMEPTSFLLPRKALKNFEKSRFLAHKLIFSVATQSTDSKYIQYLMLSDFSSGKRI